MQRRLELATGGAAKPGISTATWIKLPIYWILSCVIVVGPYAAITIGLPMWAEGNAPGGLELDTDRLARLLNPGYWIAVAIYLAIAKVITPSFDAENLGLFGSRFIDNPFSYEDDLNRSMQTFALLLAPGKFVWFTLYGTWRVIKHVTGGSD